MALKADRQIDAVEIGYFYNGTASKGSAVCVSAAGSGVGLEDSVSVATVKLTPSGAKPLGILLNDVVVVDQTRTPANWHKDECPSGSKVTILTKGWVVTDKVAGNPNAGDYAVVHDSGNISGVTLGPTMAAYIESAYPKLGHWRTKKNESGFARVYVDL